jgi:hypothetical protein
LGIDLEQPEPADEGGEDLPDDGKHFASEEEE